MNPSVLEKALRVEFQRAQSEFAQQAGANGQLLQLATTVPSDSASEDYGWLGSVPQVREWIGEKRAKQLKDYSYALRNKDFEVTIEINRFDLDDDKIGAHTIRVQDLVTRMQAFPRKMISDLIINGTTGLAFDGSAFFANRAINDNLLEGTGSTLAHLDADLDTVKQTMMAFVDDHGEKLNIVPDTIVCPPAMENKFLRLVNSAADPTATAGTNTYNPWSGRFTVIADAQLTDTNDWYAFATKQVLKPFILQVRQQSTPEFDDTRVKATKMFYFSAIMRGNAGYGFPQMAVKVVNT